MTTCWSGVSQTPPVACPVPDVRACQSGRGARTWLWLIRDGRSQQVNFRCCGWLCGRLAGMMEAGSERVPTEGYEGVVTVEWLSICRAS